MDPLQLMKSKLGIWHSQHKFVGTSVLNPPLLQDVHTTRAGLVIIFQAPTLLMHLIEPSLVWKMWLIKT